MVHLIKVQLQFYVIHTKKKKLTNIEIIKIP